ncbi:hypothetical protein [Psychrobacter ciconiae]|uniref:hypothetical protein n=1 Tax=Psychrobacter ciconiae TaxID=1553449 RepID=UPI00191B4CAD|nr:hypothetical protein [Psychrobacter ciconiae]
MSITDDSNTAKKRQIINRFLAKLTKDDPQMYYAPTAEVARALFVMIKEHHNRLPVDEQLLVKNLTSRDIEMMLGFHH